MTKAVSTMNEMTPAQIELCAQAAEKIRQCDHTMMKAAFIIGRNLISVKDALDHGQFGKWLKSEVGYTDRTARNYMNAARHLSDKTETISALPMKTVYQIAALPEQQRGEIVDMIADPESPPVKEIAVKLSEMRFKLHGSPHDQRMARHEAIKKKKADQKAAGKTPAVMKAAEARVAKELKKRAAQDAADEKRRNELAAQAIGWINAIGCELAKDILCAMKERGSWRVEEAIAKALADSAREEEPMADNVVTLDQEQPEAAPDDELTDLDLSNAA